MQTACKRLRALVLVSLLLLWATNAHAAIAVGANASFKTGTAAGSGAVTEMVGATSGDVFVALAVIGGGGSSLASPVGWTTIDNGTLGAGKFDYDISCVTRGGSAPNLTWSWTTSVYYEVYILRFTGANTTTCYDLKGTALTSASGAKGTTRLLSDIDPPSTTPSTATSMSVAVAIHWSGSGPGAGWTAPTGYTFKTDNTIGNDGMMAVKLLSSGSAEDPDEFFTTGIAAPDSLYANVVMLKEPAAGGTSTCASTNFTTLGVSCK